MKKTYKLEKENTGVLMDKEMSTQNTEKKKKIKEYVA